MLKQDHERTPCTGYGTRAELGDQRGFQGCPRGPTALDHVVHDAIEHADTAILRLTWTGVIARAVGPFHAGQVLTAHIAQFIRAQHGRVASIETFDCYEPFK